MKYNGINQNYLFLNDDVIFNFSDLVTILELIGKINGDKEKDNNGKKEFYKSLGESILKGIGSKYSIDNYINKSFKLNTNIDNDDFLNIYNGLLMIREDYIKVINCFSGDWVGNRWKHIELCNNFKIIDNELNEYKAISNSFINNIKNIDLFLATNIGEDISKNISYKELKEKYGLNINLDEIRDNYFSF